MVSSSFAHRVLIALGLLLVSTVLFVAGYAGLFGAIVQTWLNVQLAPVFKLYRAHIETFHVAFLIIGTSIPAVTGSLAILKGFYYAEINLPERLQDLINSAAKRHLQRRMELLAYAQGPFNTTDFLVPAIYANPLSRLLQMMGFSTVHYEARELASSVDVLDGDIQTLLARRQAGTLAKPPGNRTYELPRSWSAARVARRVERKLQEIGADPDCIFRRQRANIGWI